MQEGWDAVPADHDGSHLIYVPQAAGRLLTDLLVGSFCDIRMRHAHRLLKVHALSYMRASRLALSMNLYLSTYSCRFDETRRCQRVCVASRPDFAVLKDPTWLILRRDLSDVPGMPRCLRGIALLLPREAADCAGVRFFMGLPRSQTTVFCLQHQGDWGFLGYAAGCAKEPTRPLAFCRYTAQALEARLESPAWQWVPSHSNVAGNEILDSLARACAAEVFPPSWISPVATKFLQSDAVPWVWRFFSNSEACPTYEHLSQGKHEPADRCPVHLVRQPVAIEPPSIKAALEVTWCSFNVQTPREAKQALLAQLDAVACHIIALQETRNCHGTNIQGADFIELHSAAHRGDGGMALLFSKKHAYGVASQRGLFSHGSTLHASLLPLASRCPCKGSFLGVRVKAPFFQAIIMAAHAPHSGRPSAEIKHL